MNILVVVNYNDFETLNTFLYKIKNYKNIDKIIVVDNFSTDDSFEKVTMFADFFEKIEVIRTEKNGGYGYGNNYGIKYALEKYSDANLIISNPDVVFEDETIEELINELDKNNLAIIAPAVVEYNKVIWPRKILTPMKELILHMPFVYRLLKNRGKESFAFYGVESYKNKLSYVEVVPGCFFVIKSNVMKEIDFFDENIFLYYEEDVLATKLKSKGYKTAVLADARVIHNHSVSINKLYNVLEKEKIKNDSRKYFYKNYQNKKNIILFHVIYNLVIVKKFFLKLSKYFLSITKKIYNVSKFCIKYAWGRYRFLIPPSQLYKGINKVINKFNSYSKYYSVTSEYKIWIKENEQNIRYEKFLYNPLISIVIPHYNTPVKYLDKCLQSILAQSYKNFEICIADDYSTNKKSIKLLKKYEEEYPQIKVVWRNSNGKISTATNSAIEIANGEFIAFMDSDDTLAKDALYWNVKALNENKNFDLIYSDEDKLDFSEDRVQPHFKPDWNDTLLLAANYICHFVVARACLVKEIGGCKSKFDGAQDHDFLLRLTEKTNKIYHISKILYHWRMIPGSTAVSEEEKPYVVKARKAVMRETLDRRSLQGQLIPVESTPSFFNILFTNNNEKVSILIPTHDHIEYLQSCIKSIYQKTTYKNFEIIIIDHNSQEKESIEYFKECEEKYSNLKVIRCECEFNHSYLNNEGAKIATGEYLILLNSDTKVITPNWIEYMLGFARQEEIGCVGAKLLYPDNTIQHSGVVLLGDKIASEVYKGVNEDNSEYRTLVASNYSAVTFACAMVSKEKFDKVNGLNEELPADYNDVDFCLEMLKLGYKNVYVPMAKLYHYESKIRGSANMSFANYSRWANAVEYMKNKWREVLYEDKCMSHHYLKNLLEGND